MHRSQVLILLLPLFAAAVPAAEFSGARALEDTRRLAALGPRPPGSTALAKARAYITAQLRATRCQLVPDRFTATAPGGPIAMENIICKFAGMSGRAVAITGHYDTKLFAGFRFVGANDGGSSAGFLIEMARALAGRPLTHDVYLVWFDGEEAIREWSATDGLHGSRHLAGRWNTDGTAKKLDALINVDMIGDRDLGILSEHHSNARLRTLVWQTAAELGLSRHFLNVPSYVEDDHAPFVRIGVPALDLIDFDYGPGNSHWHTAEDTVDKLDPASFDVVARVVLAVLRKVPAGAAR